MRNLKKFCRAISEDPVYMIPVFYEFFKIPEHLQNDDRKHRVSEISYRPSESSEIIRGSTLGQINLSPNGGLGSGSKIQGAKWSDFRKEDLDKYCFFFRIHLLSTEFNKESNHQIYSFQIEAMFNQSINFSIDKRYSDFVTLAEQLKSITKARPPALPQKIMVMKDDKHIDGRGSSLCGWIQQVANEKMFHSKVLLEFLGVAQTYHNDVFTA